MSTNDTHWVYRCFDDAGRLLYIGMTGNRARRLSDWQCTARRSPGHWFDSVASVTWDEHPDRASASFAETAAIAAERPSVNRQHQQRTPTSRRPERYRMRRYFLRADVLAERCAAIGLESWTALAASISVDPSYMTRMAAGERPVQPSHACALADVLGVHVAHLVTIGKPDEIAAGMAQDAETAA